jgi:hypothetical protein
MHALPFGGVWLRSNNALKQLKESVMPDFVPAKEGDLLPWSATLAAKLLADPELYHITIEEAQHTADLHAAMAEAMRLGNDPATRTGSTIQGKRTAKKTAIKNIRMLNRRLKAIPELTPLLFDLGLRPNRGYARPLPPPQEPPLLWVMSVRGRSVRIRLRAAGSSRRGIPVRNWAGDVFYFAGPTPPSELGRWRYVQATRVNQTLEFPPDVPPGSQVWIVARWTSPTRHPGPACQPISTYIGGGVAAA